MVKENEKYRIEDVYGNVHVFHDIDTYCQFILSEPQLFEDIPFIINPASEKDNVNHPSHYADRKFEVIDVMQDTMTPEQFKGYLFGCAYKYLSRWDKKGKPQEDLEKAEWYLRKLIQTIKEENNNAMASNGE